MTAFAQDGTEETITIKKRYVLNLIHDVKKLHACDNLVIGLQKEIANADSLIHNQGQQITLLTTQRDTLKAITAECPIRYDILKQDNKAKVNSLRTRLFKVTLVAVVEGVIIVLLIL